MKKRVRNIVSGAVAFALVAAIMAGCGGNGGKNDAANSPAPTQAAATSTPTPTVEPTPAPTAEPTQAPTQEPVSLENAAITDGVFMDVWNPQGTEFTSYFHFYPNGVFYLSLYSNQQYQAGYYELVDKEMEYVTDKATGATAKASQAVVLTNLDGSEFQTLAYADNTVWNLPTFYEHNFIQALDSGITEADETGITVTAYMLGDDDYSLVELKHNGTFQDSIDTIVEGTWAKDGDAYILTDADSGSSYTLTANADGTAIYKGLDGAEKSLNLVASEAKEAAVTFTGSVDGAYGAMNVTIACYDDGGAVMSVDYAGMVNEAEGSWSLSDSKTTISLNMNGEDYEAPINMEDYSFAFDMTMSDGTQDVAITLSTAEAVTLVYTWRGENIDKVVLECYSNGAASLIYTGMGTMATGTWAMDTSSALPKWTITLEGYDEITPESDYATKFFFEFTDATGQLSDTIALTFADLQAATEQ